MRFGHFTAEALQAFAEAKGLDTKNQDFSEGVFDFKICEKPDGKFYGIPNQGKCKAPNREAAARPDTGFLNSQQGRAINYDTAKSQGQTKTKMKEVADALAKVNEAKAVAKAKAKAAAEVQKSLMEVADRFQSMGSGLQAQADKIVADNEAKNKEANKTGSPEENAAADAMLEEIRKLNRSN